MVFYSINFQYECLITRNVWNIWNLFEAELQLKFIKFK